MSIHDLTASLDLKQNLNIYATCKQFDSLNLILSIYDNSLQADLSNYNVRLKAMKSDKVPLVQEHAGITISTNPSNMVTIEANEQLTTTSGKTLIEVQFINKSTGKKKATFNLVLNVVPSTLEVNASISTATYTLLEELENKLDQATDYFKNINDFVSLHPDIIEIDDRINSLATQSAKNTNTILSLAGGGPKGIYATLALLQTAFPTGNSNTYVVVADGYWYYYNAGWVPGGVYQATGVNDKAIDYNKLADTLVSDVPIYKFYQKADYDDILIDIVVDMTNAISSSQIDINSQCVMSFDFYSEDANNIGVGMRIFLNNSSMAGDVLGGDIAYGTTYAPIPVTPKKFSYYSATRGVLPSTSYNYAHFMIAVKQTNRALYTTGYFRNIGVTINGIAFPIKAVGLFAPASLSYVSLQNYFNKGFITHEYLDNKFGNIMSKDNLVNLKSIDGVLLDEQLGNIFNQKEAIFGEYIAEVDGTIKINASKDIYRTDYIEIFPDTKYTFSKTCDESGAWYDKDKIFISGLPKSLSKPTILSPKNAKYLMWNCDDGLAGSLKSMIVKGSSYPSVYLPYNKYSNVYSVDNLSVKHSQIKDINIVVRNLFNKERVTYSRYIVPSDGTESFAFGTNVYCTDYIEIESNTNYTFSKICTSSGAWYDKDKVYISPLCIEEIGTTKYNALICSPMKAKYLRWNCDDDIEGAKLDMIVRGNALPDTYVAYTGDEDIYNAEWLEVLPTQIKGATLVTKNLLNPSAVVFYEYIQDTTGLPLASSSSALYHTEYIEIEPNTDYTFYKMCDQSGAWYDKDKKYISELSSISLSTITLKSPFNARYLIWNCDNGAAGAANMNIVNGSTYPSTYLEYNEKSKYSFDWLDLSFIKEVMASRWNGKTWMCIGDSITEHNFRTSKNYHDYIASKIGCTVINKGISGTGYYGRNDLAGITEIADLITVFFGTNDWANVASNNKALGMFGDTGTVTISGCINTLLTNLVAKYPTKILAIFTPLQRSDNYGSLASNNGQGYTLKQLSDLIIKYGNHFGIPVLDLYSNANLNVQNSASNSYYFTAPGYVDPDGLHPNDAGHQVLADKILAFLNTL